MQTPPLPAGLARAPFRPRCSVVACTMHWQREAQPRKRAVCPPLQQSLFNQRWRLTFIWLPNMYCLLATRFAVCLLRHVRYMRRCRRERLHRVRHLGFVRHPRRRLEHVRRSVHRRILRHLGGADRLPAMPRGGGAVQHCDPSHLVHDQGWDQLCARAREWGPFLRFFLFVCFLPSLFVFQVFPTFPAQFFAP